MAEPTDDLCDVEIERHGATVTFERLIAATPTSVWHVLTMSEELERWLAPGSIEGRVGGTVDIRFDPDQIVSGEVTVWEPPTTLEYTWLIPGEPRSVIRFWLVPSGADTVLRVTHRRLPTPMAAGYAAGWHAHADQLAAAVVGTPIPDWDDRFAVLLPRYVELVSS